MRLDLGDDGAPQPPYLWIAVVTALPVLFAPVAAYLRARTLRPAFWYRLEQLALLYAVAGASFAAILASLDAFEDAEGVLGLGSQMVRGMIGLTAGALTILARPGASGQMSGAIMAGAGVTVALAYGLSGMPDLLPALLFMALWVGIAAAALYAGWRHVFQIAVGIVAVRLIVLSFELASDLLFSGFGLILSGLLILGIAWVAYRISSEFAPSAEDEDQEEEAQT